MSDLDEGVRRFRRNVFPAQAALFEQLATNHHPGALFIGCSDARVVPELITQSAPGELFVIRTAGNIVPPYAQGADGVAASIEYAVGALGVSEVIVCGHSGCGAMTALATGTDLADLPAVASWLRLTDAPLRAAGAEDADPAAKVASLVRSNVVSQLENLRAHPSVARALAQNTVTLRGWVYDIGSGTVEEVAADGGADTRVA